MMPANVLLKTTLLLALLLGLAACANQAPRFSGQSDDKRAAQANADLGFEYIRQGDYPRALGKLRKALEQDPNQPQAHSALALLYQQLEEYGQAEVHFKKALAYSDKNPNIQNNYGVFLCGRGRHQEALGYFMEVAKNPLYPQPETAYTNAGVCARRIPDVQLAEGNFREALQRNPQYAEALAQMASMSYDQGDYMRARAFIQRYESVAPESPQMLQLALRTERQLGNGRAAARYEQRLRSTYPEISTR